MTASTVSKLVQKLREATKENSPQINRALTRIGNLVKNRAVLNARNKDIKGRTGALIGSINYNVGRNSVIVGPFGVRYARFHEYGAKLHPGAVRAMFAAMRRAGPPRPSKGVMTFSNGSATLKARPFLIPALRASRARVKAILREELLN